jgi:hypothetical protein
MELSVKRAGIDCELERYQVKERGKWKVISVAGDAEVNQAAEMADRFNRLFLRTLRQLRDLRRYNLPVIINNAEQVNLATEGGQQVYVNNKRRAKKKSNRRKRDIEGATKAKTKQLSEESSQESIRMNAASEPASIKQGN